jgi:starch synthase
MNASSPLRILYAASEVHPLVKTGGLADVSGALPDALRRLGSDARVLLPAYPGVLARIGGERIAGPWRLLEGVPEATLVLGSLPGYAVPVYALDCPALYDRPGSPYLDEHGRDWPDNALRFALLSRAAALFGAGEGVGGWVADVVHCNDWQTGLAPAYLRHLPDARASTVFTIHNAGYQGNFPREVFPRLGLPAPLFGMQGIEFFGRVSFFKAGILFADRVSAVSPTYARELETATHGHGMEGVIAANRHKLVGVLNGIDAEVWNPATDPYLPRPYRPERVEDKSASKRALQQRFGLLPEPRTALIGMVTRLTWQKGIDLVLNLLERLLQEPVQIALLGAGDRPFEARWEQAAGERPAQVGVVIGYDEPLAHLIEAGSDLFLMPSRYEPCGLNQMYSMRYGTPPLVRDTGGLSDSVVDTTPASLAAGTATGFVFNGANEAELYACLLRALLCHRDRATWRAVQRNGMYRDFSWDHSAAEYLRLYRETIGRR